MICPRFVGGNVTACSWITAPSDQMESLDGSLPDAALIAIGSQLQRLSIRPRNKISALSDEPVSRSVTTLSDSYSVEEVASVSLKSRAAITGIAALSSQHHAAVCSSDGRASLVRLNGDHTLSVTESVVVHRYAGSKSAAASTSIAVQPSTEKPLVAISSENGQVALLDSEKGFTAEPQMISADSVAVNSVFWQDHNTILTAGESGQMKLYDIRDLSQPALLLESTELTPLWCVTAHPIQSMHVASGDLLGIVSVYDLRIPENIKVSSFVGHEADVTGLAFHTHASYLSSVSLDGTLSHLRWKDAEQQPHHYFPRAGLESSGPLKQQEFFHYEGSWNCLAIEPESSLILMGGDGCLHVQPLPVQ